MYLISLDIAEEGIIGLECGSGLNLEWKKDDVYRKEL